MPVTTEEERRRLEAAGAKLTYEYGPLLPPGEHQVYFAEQFEDESGLTRLRIHQHTEWSNSAPDVHFADGDPDTLLRWLLAWRAPHLLDAEAEIARFRAEVERLQAELSAASLRAMRAASEALGYYDDDRR